jgi:WD40 repeat protein
LVAFSSNGWLLASSLYDKSIQLWDPATGALQQMLKGHTDRVKSVAFSPNGRLLASSSGDKIKGYIGRVWSVAFSPNGRLLASCLYDKTIQLWDPAIGTL